MAWQSKIRTGIEAIALTPEELKEKAQNKHSLARCFKILD